MPFVPGITLNQPDFQTSRPPFVPPGQETDSEQNPIPYTMVGEFSDHLPTDGQPRKFYAVVRVKDNLRDSFLRAVLPDVREIGYTIPDQVLQMSPYSVPEDPTIQYRRSGLIRFGPERHQRYPTAYVVDAVVMRGEGFPLRTDDVGMAFFTNVMRQVSEEVTERAKMPGNVLIGLTYQDLPYTVYPDPDGDLDLAGNALANNEHWSEILRYCIFKPMPKGRSLQIVGGTYFFVNDDGTLIYPAAGKPPLVVQEAQPLFIPTTEFTITLKMVPRVPFAALYMRNMVNQYNNIPFPTEILKDYPDVGTLLYRGFELSDPYFTVTGQKVFDIHYALGYDPAGKDFNRGWNSAWCANKREFRRIVAGRALGSVGSEVIHRVSPDDAIVGLPRTNGDPDQSRRVTIAGANTYDFGDLQNIFRFEGELIQ